MYEIRDPDDFHLLATVRSLSSAKLQQYVGAVIYEKGAGRALVGRIGNDGKLEEAER